MYRPRQEVVMPSAKESDTNHLLKAAENVSEREDISVENRALMLALLTLWDKIKNETPVVEEQTGLQGSNLLAAYERTVKVLYALGQVVENETSLYEINWDDLKVASPTKGKEILSLYLNSNNESVIEVLGTEREGDTLPPYKVCEAFGIDVKAYEERIHS